MRESARPSGSGLSGGWRRVPVARAPDARCRWAHDAATRNGERRATLPRLRVRRLPCARMVSHMGEIERLKRALSRLEPSDGNKSSHDCTARVVHDGLSRAGRTARHGTEATRASTHESLTLDRRPYRAHQHRWIQTGTAARAGRTRLRTFASRTHQPAASWPARHSSASCIAQHV